MAKEHIFSEFMVEILGNYEYQDLHFFAVIATSLMIQEATEEEKKIIPTACVAMRENDENVYLIYNTDFTDKLSEPKLRFLFFHEIFHVILMTQLRAELHDHNPVLVNITHDMVINTTLLDHYGPKSKLKNVEIISTKMPQIPKDYKGLRNYEALIQDIEQKSNKAGGVKQYLEKMGVKFMPGDGKGKGQPGEGEIYGIVDKQGNPTGETLDVHLDPSQMTSAQAQNLDRVARTVARGLESSNMREVIQGLTPKPTVNVLDYINKYTRAMKGEIKKSTWHKRNRKMPDFIKGKRKRAVYFNLVLDTSGSMAIKDMTGLLECVMRNGICFKLIQIDTKVQDIKLIKTKYQLHSAIKEFKGRGGTILQPALDYCKKNELEEPVVVLTDGYTDTLTFHNRGLVVYTGSESPISKHSSKVTQIKFEPKN